MLKSCARWPPNKTYHTRLVLLFVFRMINKKKMALANEYQLYSESFYVPQAPFGFWKRSPGRPPASSKTRERITPSTTLPVCFSFAIHGKLFANLACAPSRSIGSEGRSNAREDERENQEVRIFACYVVQTLLSCSVNRATPTASLLGKLKNAGFLRPCPHLN